MPIFVLPGIIHISTFKIQGCMKIRGSLVKVLRVLKDTWHLFSKSMYSFSELLVYYPHKPIVYFYNEDVSQSKGY